MSALTPPAPLPLAPASPSFRYLVGVAALVSALAGWWIWLRPPASKGPVTQEKTAVAAIGPIESTIRLNGQTSARSFYNVTAPIQRGPEASGSMVILKLAKGGSMVKTGDSLFEIDGQSMADHVDDVKDQLRQGVNDVAKRKAEQSVEMGQLEQTLRIAKSQVDKARLDYQAAEVKVDVERELLKLAVDEAEARYKQQLQDLAQRKASHAAEIKILETTIARHKIHLYRHEVDLSRFTVKATKPGMVVLQTINRGGDLAQIDAGDQIYPGMPVLKVVDPASMQVEANVNQAQSAELRIGQRVRIGFDAFPDLRLTGRIYSIGALASSGTARSQFFIRQVPVRITLDKLEPRVIPDLSVFVDVIGASEESALRVPLTAIEEEGGKSYVRVKSGEGFEKRAVETGLRSNTEAAVTNGLRAGEEVRVN